MPCVQTPMGLAPAPVGEAADRDVAQGAGGADPADGHRPVELRRIGLHPVERGSDLSLQAFRSRPRCARLSGAASALPADRHAHSSAKSTSAHQRTTPRLPAFDLARRLAEDRRPSSTPKPAPSGRPASTSPSGRRARSPTVFLLFIPAPSLHHGSPGLPSSVECRDHNAKVRGPPRCSQCRRYSAFDVELISVISSWRRKLPALGRSTASATDLRRRARYFAAQHGFEALHRARRGHRQSRVCRPYFLATPHSLMSSQVRTVARRRQATCGARAAGADPSRGRSARSRPAATPRSCSAAATTKRCFASMRELKTLVTSGAPRRDHPHRGALTRTSIRPARSAAAGATIRAKSRRRRPHAGAACASSTR